MNMCKGICENHIFKRPKASEYLYILGAKYCKRCSKWLDMPTEKIFCPCCHVKMRTRPTKSSRTRVLKTMQTELNRP